MSLGLFTWLVYVRTYCVPIVTLNQSKLSRLLYLGDAQIIIIDSVYFLMEETPGVTMLHLLYRYWSEIESGFRELDDTPPPRIPRNYHKEFAKYVLCWCSLLYKVFSRWMCWRIKKIKNIATKMNFTSE